MGPGAGRGSMEPRIPADGPPIAAIDRELRSLSDRLNGAVRWSNWFSGLAWAFGIAVFVALILPVQTTNGTSSSSGPAYTLLAVLLAIIVLLALAVLALLLGRREALGGESPRASRSPASQSERGWVVAVQQTQRMVTTTKQFAELSFLPLVLGTFVVGEWGISVLLRGTSLEAVSIPFGIVPAALLGIVLYLATRQWIGRFQALLDHQVGELSRLEAEFIWRFSGTPA